MANFGALGILRHAYRTLNKPSTSALFGEWPAISSSRILAGRQFVDEGVVVIAHFVRPRQRDLVEVRADLPRECPQIVEPARAPQQLFVVAASADRCPVLAGDLVADLAIVFHRGPDADVDRGQHGALSNHCKTSA
jgi:hypothetical protein